MLQNQPTNKFSTFIGIILLIGIIGFTIFISKHEPKTVKNVEEIEEQKIELETFKQHSDSIATQKVKSQNPLYPNIFDEIYKDTCIYDFAIYDNKKDRIIRYIPPYAGKICIKHISKDKLIIKIESGFDFDRDNSKNVLTVVTDTLIKTSSGIIHKEVNILKSSIYDRMKKTHKENDFLTLTMKYLHLSFKNKKYIDSLINIDEKKYNDIEYYKARSIIAFSSLTDTTQSKILHNEWSKIMYYKKKEILHEQKITIFSTNTCFQE